MRREPPRCYFDLTAGIDPMVRLVELEVHSGTSAQSWTISAQLCAGY